MVLLWRLQSASEAPRRPSVLFYDCLSCLSSLMRCSFVFSSFERPHAALFRDNFHVLSHQLGRCGPGAGLFILFKLSPDLLYFFDEMGIIESLYRSQCLEIGRASCRERVWILVVTV